MSDQEKYLLAIQLAEAAAKVSAAHYELGARLAEVALELLGKKPE